MSFVLLSGGNCIKNGGSDFYIEFNTGFRDVPKVSTIERKSDSGKENVAQVASSCRKPSRETRSNSQLLRPITGVNLYPISVKTQGGEKLELQLSPGDSVLDVRQFLLEAPETSYFTCYDLLLHTKDGSIHHLEDYNEISEVADITSGSCFLEIVAGMKENGFKTTWKGHRAIEVEIPYIEPIPGSKI